MGLVKHGKYVLARLTHDYKNKADQLIDIDPDEAQILGLTFEDNQDYESMYLTIEALEDGKLTIYLNCYVSSSSIGIYYSLNNNDWIYIENPGWQQNSYDINISNGDKILLKSNFKYAYENRGGNYPQVYSLNINFKSKLYGNILSLNYGDNFYQYNKHIYKSDNTCTYYCLFRNSKIIDISNLILPIDVDKACYNGMFIDCNLLEIPMKELSAINLDNGCYCDMFNGCTKLTKTPILKGNDNNNSYLRMFAGCPNITDITLLCTSSITNYSSINNIFDDNLKYIKGTFTKYEGVDLDNLIPIGWTVRELSQETGEVVNEYVKHLNN